MLKIEDIQFALKPAYLSKMGAKIGNAGKSVFELRRNPGKFEERFFSTGMDAPGHSVDVNTVISILSPSQQAAEFILWCASSKCTRLWANAWCNDEHAFFTFADGKIDAAMGIREDIRGDDVLKYVHPSNLPNDLGASVYLGTYKTKILPKGLKWDVVTEHKVCFVHSEKVSSFFGVNGYMYLYREGEYFNASYYHGQEE